MIVFTLINLILLAVDSNSMFLFSATIPYYLVVIGITTEIYNVMVISLIAAGAIVFI